MTTDKDETTEQAATANENETVGKKRGAPSVPEELKRTSSYVLNLTVEQKKQYMDYAKAKNMKFSELLRTAVEEYMINH